MQWPDLQQLYDIPDTILGELKTLRDLVSVAALNIQQVSDVRPYILNLVAVHLCHNPCRIALRP